MGKKAPKNIIPPQMEGQSTDIIEYREMSNESEANQFFMMARQRLFDINKWNEIAEGLSAVFRLVSETGELQEGPPARGHYIRIDIPGPGPASGHGYDWVQIELVEDNTDPAASNYAAMRVRPAKKPGERNDTAHFFEAAATSSFIVRRDGPTIYVEIHGRNEKANTNNETVKDNVRNWIVSTGAIAGLATIQWRKLAKGILEL